MRFWLLLIPLTLFAKNLRVPIERYAPLLIDSGNMFQDNRVKRKVEEFAREKNITPQITGDIWTLRK